ncbi:hypothetical protein K1T71_001907 [Dendrolimus kikuchii]|uniref:Uncharacterized protein n=1 Tax=Dendrolimus kikuchii TaxID=765133 RepID=A0ACC1DF05_9NEOP|nr:hypothetical protein K1T71_001907 [Dendrolimus kikuchii]
MICKKCNNDESTVLLRKKDYYCEKCFINNTNHKFRACIGKNKLFSSQENVLVCLSGEEGSTVLLNLISNGLCLENHKKLRINPIFLHLYNNNDIAEKVIEDCKKHDFVVYVVNISDYMSTTIDLPEPNSLPKLNVGTNNTVNIFNNLPATAFNDMFIKIKRTLFIKYAKVLHCNFIFTAETTGSLASSLLSSIALGRGSQVEDDIGFIDNRDDIKIVRPMKDISKEELHFYIKIKKLNIQHHYDMKKNSLQVLINNFVSDLQENFPSTISTVCKTAEKLGVASDNADNESNHKCKICESVLNIPDGRLTALQATDFSRIVSLQKPSKINTHDKNVIKIVQENQHSMFPYISAAKCVKKKGEGVMKIGAVTEDASQNGMPYYDDPKRLGKGEKRQQS